MEKKRYDDKRKVLRKGESQKRENLYMYRWTDRDGKRQCIYASTLNELREQEDKIAIEKVLRVSRTSATLNDQIELNMGIKVKLADSTAENYKYYYQHSIKDSSIGQMKIIDIKKSDILTFYADLTDDGYSAGTIKILHKIIHPALQLACDDGIIIKNPADGCTKEYSEDVEKKYALTFSEEKEFLDRIALKPRMKRYYPMYAIMLKTGLRISEVIGLTWDDIDIDKKEIHMNHQVQYRRINGKTQYFANSTKTNAGLRTIPMMDNVYKLFQEQRKIWMQTKKDTASGYQPSYPASYNLLPLGRIWL